VDVVGAQDRAASSSADELFSQLRGAMGSGDGDGGRVGGVALRRVGAVVAAVAAVAAIAIGLSWVRPVRTAGEPGGAIEQSTSSSSSSVPSSSSSAPGAQVWPEQPIEVEGTEVRRGDDRWTVGDPGDLVAVGDWDCDGEPTPAVLRAGRLFLFASWADDAVAVAGPQAPTDAVHVEAKGCGLAVVQMSSGLTVDVETMKEQG
jgi:hypothetical protein